MSMRKIYREIAKKDGVSVAEVKREMEKAIGAAWDNPNKTAENAAMQNAIRPDGTKPTVEELIAFASQNAKKDK